MNRLTVTVVDILGVLVPGAVLLLGCTLAMLPATPSPELAQLLRRVPGVWNPWVLAGVLLAGAYVTGFLLRLVSIRILNILTLRVWKDRVRREAAALAPALEQAVNDPTLTKALQELHKPEDHGGGRGRDPGQFAPYFHFAKRLIRRHPELWTEAERLEAEVRLVAGLFIPFLVLLADGVILTRVVPEAWTLIPVGLLGASVVLIAFPERRAREVLYDQLLAIVSLRTDQRARAAKPAETDAEARPEQERPSI
jgi:hypothetical protein